MEVKNADKHTNIIEAIERGSIAEELGIESGDVLISVNGHPIMDILDYKYQISDDYVEMTIQKKNGEIWELEIEKDINEDIGIIFTNPLIDKAKSCRNKCIFCFIDQLPKGMRNTLYFKDDDSRLSFLQGNFITLTNLSDDEIDRIIFYKLSPINISVHTTDPELRVKMLNNKNAGKIYDILQRFSKANIEMNCQIVLCPGINDGIYLDKTLEDLAVLYPNVKSVAVVPVGVTRYREGLFKLETYNRDTAKELLNFIGKKQNKYLKELGSRFVFVADEFYILAGKEVPSFDEYEGFPQLENGVGLMRLFYEEVLKALTQIDKDMRLNKKFTIATGMLAYPFMKDVAKLVMSKFKGLDLQVEPIINNFFGETITVAGLITGSDLIGQLDGKDLGDGLIIPKSMLKRDEDIFLDDITVGELEERLNIEVIALDVDGYKFVDFYKKHAR
ncbi:DUF512 domain-containing protein [Caloranaerobacter azorensis]|uniref:DUF512 domain-containing protein n=1 Tax=Caloranaerobacter azorensis TaxID=116090 RepID=A0A6P1YFL0_9FIRM|nr:DUF512 domain-containing protein [Caloranaerobacter azorensis]QIB26676.1 DUF512 domain-containing protein [Caloranaerobacter azorensis]